jgi:hypothetical protein
MSPYKLSVDHASKEIIWDPTASIDIFFGWVGLVVYGVKLEYFEDSVAPTLARGIPRYEITWENGYNDRVLIHVRERREAYSGEERNALQLRRLVEKTLGQPHVVFEYPIKPPQE